MRNVNKSIKLVALMAAASGMMLSSCTHESVYDPEYANKVLQQNWKDQGMGEIDPNQDWTMAMVGNVTITSNEAGTMYLFNGDPLNKNTNASCIGKFAVRPGETVSAKVDLQKGTQFVYAGLYTADGALKVRPVDVSEGKINVAFGQATTRAAKKAMPNTDAPSQKWTPSITIPTSKPADAVAMPTDYNSIQGGKNYVVSSNCQINCGSPVNIYLEGNVKITSISVNGGSSDVTGNHTKLFVLPGANVSIDQINNVGYEVYVASGATLNFNNSNLFGCFVYNQGIVNDLGDKELNINNNSVFVNEGQLNVTKRLYCANENTQLWNIGSIKAYDFNTDGSSSTYNSGNVVVENKTSLNSSRSGWYNDGSWTTNDMETLSSSLNWINNCKLIVNNQFYINLGVSSVKQGAFIVNGGGSVVTKDLFYHTGSVVLGSKALFKVTGTATMRYSEPNRYGNGSGFYGEGDDYAVLQMNKVVRGVETSDNNVWYCGKLYVATNDHFDQGTTGGSDHFYELFGDAQMTGYDNADIKIPASECNPGYNFIPSPDPKPEAQTFIFACEDLGTSDDFDFNDIVFSVSYAAGETEATVKVLAAGGTLASQLYYDTTNLGEVHDLLGAAPGDMINTLGGITNTHNGSKITVPSTWTLMGNKDKFVIYVEENGVSSIVSSADVTGKAPQMIIVPGEWKWPLERVNIKDAYPQFVNWVKDVSNTEWYKSYEGDKVVK